MISQFFILSQRGDVIIRRDYLGNIPLNCSEQFFRKQKFWDENESAPPVFNIEGITYLSLHEGGLIFVAATRDNVLPSMVLEVLRRMASLVKDYCGSMTEDALRKNFILAYEVFDEVLDYGIPQSASAQDIKQVVFTEPVIVQPAGYRMLGVQSSTRAPSAVYKSVLDNQRSDGRRVRDEIYIDVVESLSCVWQHNQLLSSQVDGEMQVKSFLSGNPPIRIALNDDLLIMQRQGTYATHLSESSQCCLDDCNFHPDVDLTRFDTERVLSMVPPEGNFTLMSYRSTYDFAVPFRVITTVESDPYNASKCIIEVMIRCDIPKDRVVSSLEITVNMPRSVTRVYCDVDVRQKDVTASHIFSDTSHVLTVKLTKVAGQTEFTVRAKATLNREYGASFKGDLGPVNLSFSIPQYTASKLALRYLSVQKQGIDKATEPGRWVRYVATSTAYTCRV